MSTARISRGIALALALLTGAPAVAAGSEMQQQAEGQGTQMQVLQRAQLPVVRIKGIGSLETLQGALDALEPFSADQVETLAGIAENLLDVAKKSGMTTETLRQLLTDLQTVPQSRWFGLLRKYTPSPTLTGAVQEAVKRIKSMDLGVEFSAREALALADALLKALEGGWTPQGIAQIKGQKAPAVRAVASWSPAKAVRDTLSQMEKTETFLAALTLDPKTPGTPVQLYGNLNLQEAGDMLQPSALQPSGPLHPGGLQPGGPLQATIRGGLNGRWGTGSYGFAVNLANGDIRNGFMNGAFSSSSTFDVTGGSGKAQGNNFSLAGFTGIIDSGGGSGESVTSATLDGTAAKGFGSVGDIGAAGSYTVTGTISSPETGDITSGQRVN